MGKAFYGAEAGMYQMLGAAGSGHRPFYVRPESRILTDDRFPSSGVGARRGFFGQPRVGSAVFVWKNTGTAETDQFTLSHVGLCVAPGMMVSLTYGRLALESWDQLLARYNTRNEPIEGLSYGAPLV